MANIIDCSVSWNAIIRSLQGRAFRVDSQGVRQPEPGSCTRPAGDLFCTVSIAPGSGVRVFLDRDTLWRGRDITAALSGGRWTESTATWHLRARVAFYEHDPPDLRPGQLPLARNFRGKLSAGRLLYRDVEGSSEDDAPRALRHIRRIPPLPRRVRGN